MLRPGWLFTFVANYMRFGHYGFSGPTKFFQRPEVLIYCTDMSIKEARPHPAFLTVHTCMLRTETKAPLESGQVLVEHSHGVAKIQFRSQAKSALIQKIALKWRVNRTQKKKNCLCVGRQRKVRKFCLLALVPVRLKLQLNMIGMERAVQKWKGFMLPMLWDKWREKYLQFPELRWPG